MAHGHRYNNQIVRGIFLGIASGDLAPPATMVAHLGDFMAMASAVHGLTDRHGSMAIHGSAHFHDRVDCRVGGLCLWPMAIDTTIK